MAWEYISHFFGFSTYGQGFHFIKSFVSDFGIKDMSNTSLRTITVRVATAKQVQNEFKLKASPTSSQRWFAKKIGENKYKMRFSTAKAIEDIAYFK